MNGLKFLAVALIALGTLGLIYGGFSYTSERHRGEILGMHLQVDEQRWVTVPIWVGLAAVVGGVVLLSRRRS
jgi:TRAP-type C4-dicarboxylate transport system permease small subunit